MKQISLLALHLGYGGGEKSIINLANNLSHKYNVEIICVYKLYDNPVFSVNDNVTIKYLINEKPNREQLKAAIKGKNIKVFVRELFYSFWVLYKRKKYMKNAIKKCDADIIISSRLLFSYWLSKVNKKNTLKVAWEHNHHNNNKRFIRKVVKSCRNLDYLVNVSNELHCFYKEKLSKYKCKSVFIPNMVEIDGTLSSLDTKNIVSIGRLEKEKGFLDLIDVFKKVLVIEPKCILHIVGDGSLRDLIEERIKEYGLMSSVIMHGYRGTAYINNLLNSQSVYVMTSLTESFGIVLIEAMDKGIPCIAFDSAQGALEIICNNKNGYLIKGRNKDEMAKKICLLLNNYDKRVQMGKEAFLCGKKYTPDKVIKLWEKILNSGK